MDSCPFKLNATDAPCGVMLHLDPVSGLCGWHGGRFSVKDGSRICGSPKRGKPGEFCQVGKGLDPDNGRCRLHGGKSPKGMASPHFKHGRHSRTWQSLLPKGLAKHFKEALHDPELLNLEAEAALSDATIAQILSEVKDGGGIVKIKELRERFDDLQTAIIKFMDAVPHGEGDIDEKRPPVTDGLRLLGDALTQGAKLEAARKEIRIETNHKRRIVATEARRRQDLRLNISAVSAFALVDAVVDIIRTHIDDREKLDAIGRDIGNIIDPADEGEASTRIN